MKEYIVTRIERFEIVIKAESEEQAIEFAQDNFTLSDYDKPWELFYNHDDFSAEEVLQ